MSDVEPTFQIEKIYVKDLSLELPNAPQVFMQTEQPQLEVQINNESALVSEGIYEVTVGVTITARAGESTLFLVEALQAGIFQVRGVPQEDLEPLLGIACPTILYPYVRETVSDMVTRGGFPPVLLAPVSFEALYAQRLQQQADGAGPQAELAS
ncbi:MAG: protein-export chaperone SecB [Proteobacteria bacterium]|nr:protein-export chaperone SecB [Pseudomonadota bacterium]